MDVFIKEKYVQTDTHLLTLFKHSQHLSLHTFVQNHLTGTHTQIQNRFSESQPECVQKKALDLRVSLMKISLVQEQTCSPHTLMYLG